MKTFTNIQDPFIDKEFCSAISKFTPIQYVNGIPTFGRKRTFFWSSEQFEEIEQQYIVSESISNPLRYFFVKNASTYDETFDSYHKHFRNEVRKADKNGVSVEENCSTDDRLKQECYRIYDENMIRHRSFSYPFEFFCELCGLSYSKIYVARKGREIVSFGLMIGNFLFLQSSTEKGRTMCANNMLYDRIYHAFENVPVFLGTSMKPKNVSVGHYRFKMHSGATPVPAAPLKFDILESLSSSDIFRDNRVVGAVVRRLDMKKHFNKLFP